MFFFSSIVLNISIAYCFQYYTNHLSLLITYRYILLPIVSNINVINYILLLLSFV